MKRVFPEYRINKLSQTEVLLRKYARWPEPQQESYRKSYREFIHEHPGAQQESIVRSY